MWRGGGVGVRRAPWLGLDSAICQGSLALAGAHIYR